MQWIQYFSESKVPFQIYKLSSNDSVTCTINTAKHPYIIILQGIIYVLKIFTNHEKITLGILTKGDIISKPKNTKYCYYTLVALEKTFMMSFKRKDITKDKYIIESVAKSYEKTLYKYEIMNCILSHKSAKQRIIQLLFLLYQEFALVEKTQIRIPFYISQITLSTIIGSKKNIVNKIMNELYNINLISYSYQKYICITDPFILNYYHSYKKIIINKHNIACYNSNNYRM